MPPDSNALDILEARGFVSDVTDREGLHGKLADPPVTFYYGMDPTAPSLHVGNLVGLMAMSWLQRSGHRAVALVGGATGRIGDPSGRDRERELLDETELNANIASFREQLTRFVDLSDEDRGILVDNYVWTAGVGLLEFLRDVGKHFSVNAMIARESVRRRLESREHGISFTEFSYQLLQAYDFSQLYANEHCELQIGGSDQWGNITAGVDLTRRLHGATVHGLVWPLVETSGGQKFSKSAGNAPWLNGELTSPYAYYQWWLNTHDDDVVDFLKLFTFLDDDEIERIAREHANEPSARFGHRRLAEEATLIAHGGEGLREAEAGTQAMFGDGTAVVAEGVPSVDVPQAELAAGVGLLDLMNRVGAAESNSQARRLVRQGGVYLHDERVEDEGHVVTDEDLDDEGVIRLRVGKKRHYLVRASG